VYDYDFWRAYSQLTVNMEDLAQTCDTPDCPLHFHAHDSIFVSKDGPKLEPALREEQQDSTSRVLEPAVTPKKITEDGGQKRSVDVKKSPEEHGFRRIIRNFTPS